MIHSPSWFTARMKDSRNWPSGRKDAKPCSEGLVPASASSSAGSAEEQLAEEQLEERTPFAAATLLCCAAGTMAAAAKGSTPGEGGTAGPVSWKPSSSAGARSGETGDHPAELGGSHWP